MLGVTPPKEVLSKFQDHEFGVPLEASEKLTVPPAVIDVVLALIEHVGGLF